jgi:Ca2+/H+ antiporter, TMEM165/GDT1 family
VFAAWTTKLFMSTFVAIFLRRRRWATRRSSPRCRPASGETSQHWVVFAASALALVAASAIAVGAAEIVGRFVSLLRLKRAAGVLFIVLGVLALRESFGSARAAS